MSTDEKAMKAPESPNGAPLSRFRAVEALGEVRDADGLADLLNEWAAEHSECARVANQECEGAGDYDLGVTVGLMLAIAALRALGERDTGERPDHA